MGLFRGKDPRENGADDAVDRAAREAGTETPNANTDTNTTHWLLKIIFFPLAFRDIRAGIFVLIGIIATLAIWYFVGWEPLVVTPVAAWFSWQWWKHNWHVDNIWLIEVRVEGQRFEPPHLPFPMRVQDAGTRIYLVPRKVFEQCKKFGAFVPVFEQPPDIVWCDYADPMRWLIIFNQDPEWSNAALVAQVNQGLAKNIRRAGHKEAWLREKMRDAYLEFKQGMIDKETFISIVSTIDPELEVIRDSPFTRRSVMQTYQGTIPRYKRQVMHLLHSVDEYALALAAQLAYRWYGRPMGLEQAGQIDATITRFQRLKIKFSDELDLDPTLMDSLGETDPAIEQGPHELALPDETGVAQQVQLRPLLPRQKVL